MTQPVQEPTTERDIGGLGWRTAQLARRPTSPGVPSSVPWIAVYDNFFYGQSISTTGSGDNLQFPFIDWSDDAAPWFDYVRSASTIGASNNYNPKILQKGLYLFSWVEVATSAAAEYSVNYHLPIGNYPGGGRDHQWTAYSQDESARWSNTDVQQMGSVLVPISATNLTIYPYIDLNKPGAVSTFSMTFDNFLYIARLGDLNNDANFNSSWHNDPYPDHPE